MATNFKQLLAEADSLVPKLSPVDAVEKIRSSDVLVLDVRDAAEVGKTGKVRGAINVSRGLLELTVDQDAPHYDPIFQKNRTVLVYCTAGLRSALAGRTLLDMGFGSVFNIGGLKELVEAGIQTESP